MSLGDDVVRAPVREGGITLEPNRLLGGIWLRCWEGETHDQRVRAAGFSCWRLLRPRWGGCVSGSLAPSRRQPAFSRKTGSAEETEATLESGLTPRLDGRIVYSTQEGVLWIINADGTADAN